MKDQRPASRLIHLNRLLWRRWHSKQITGVDRVCLAYLDHLAKDAQGVIQWGRHRRILAPRTSQTLFALLRDNPPAIRPKIVRALLADLRHGQRWQEGGGRLYFNVGHAGLADDGLIPWVRRRQIKPIYLLHDLIPLTHPEYARPNEALRHFSRISHMLATAAGIICNSTATAQDLINFAQSHSLKVPPTLVAHLGITEALQAVTAEPPFKTPFFIMLGTIEARKNHLLILNVWRALVARHGARAPKLIIIGQRGWECEQVVDMLERCTTLHDHVVELNACSDADVINHLRHARAMLFPSFTEGYGIPLIEALMLGTPVIASNLPVFHEIAGDIPTYLDPIDGLGWLNAIENYAPVKSKARAAQCRRMHAYVPMDWSTHFKRVEDWLATLRLDTPRPQIIISQK